MESINKWLFENSHLALIIKKGTFERLCGSYLIIPEKTIGFKPENHYGVIPSGRKVEPPDTIILIKKSSFPFSCIIPNIKTKDNFITTVSVAIDLFVETDSNEMLKNFWNHFKRYQQQIGVEEVFESIYTLLCKEIKESFELYDIEILYQKKLKIIIQKTFQEHLQKSLYEIGLIFLELKGIEISCKEYEKLKKEEKQRSSLNQDIVFADKIAKLIKNMDIKALASQIRNENIRSEILKALIEKEMTPEQLRAKSIEKILEKEWTHLSKKIIESVTKKIEEQNREKIASKNVAFIEFPSEEKEHKTEKAQTKYVILATPDGITQFQYSQENNIIKKKNISKYPHYQNYDLDNYDIGGIRSVRTSKIQEKNCILAGAVHGLLVIDPQKKKVTPLLMPYRSKKHKGFNSSLFINNKIFATHSEYGLVQWDMEDKFPKGKQLQKEQTRDIKTLRGLIQKDAVLYFARNKTIYALDSEKANTPPIQIYEGSKSEITSFVIIEDQIYASNSEGSILTWERKKTDMGKTILNLKKVIYMIKKIYIHNRWCLLIGCKESGILCYIPDTSSQIRYHAKVQTRWVHGDNNIIMGVSKDLSSLLFWEASCPQKPPFKLTTSLAINDITTSSFDNM